MNVKELNQFIEYKVLKVLKILCQKKIIMKHLLINKLYKKV